VTEQHLVLTPEKVIVSYRLAGVGSRIMAHFLDLILFGMITYAIMIGVGMLSLVVGESLVMVLASLITAFGFFLYFIIQEGVWQGQTLGKRVFNLRVMSADGTPVTMAGAIYRNLLRPADIFPGFYLVGIVSIFTNERSQRVGDLAAGTVVVHDPRVPFGFTPAPHRYGLHPFEDSVGPLQRMTLEEYFAIKRLCDRFPELPPVVQNKSIEEIWVPFAKAQRIAPLDNVHPIYQMEAVVMKFGRMHKLI